MTENKPMPERESDWGTPVMSQLITITYKRPWWKFWEKSYQEQISTGDAHRILNTHMIELLKCTKYFEFHFFQTEKEHPNHKGYPDTRAKCELCGLSWRDGKHFSGG